VKVYKEGRKVTGYQLVNFTEFNADGRYIGRAVKAPGGVPKAVVAPVEVAETV
jgi:hypothetical protein